MNLKYILAFALIGIKAVAFDATDRYEPRQVEGWTVLMHKRLLTEQPELAQRTLKELEHQLYQITRVVPAKAVTELKKIRIWVEHEHPRHPCMCYHLSAGWLKANDFNPEKAKSVEIANPKNFLSWTHDQPWMVLHELAHGYHHIVVGHDNAEMKAAYKKMIESGKYKSVQHINGQVVKHYALRNDEEYFAEASEAYFGTNDFYPYVRSELRVHDPEIFELMRKLWHDQ